MLFCIDNLNWMLENWKSVRINKFKKAKKKKKPEVNLHVLACISCPAPQR